MSSHFWCMFGWLCATLALAHVGDHTGTSIYVGVEEASQRGTSLVAPCPALPSCCICICVCLSKALYWLAMAIDDWSHLNTIFDLLAPNSSIGKLESQIICVSYDFKCILQSPRSIVHVVKELSLYLCLYRKGRSRKRFGEEACSHLRLA